MDGTGYVALAMHTCLQTMKEGSRRTVIPQRIGRSLGELEVEDLSSSCPKVQDDLETDLENL